ncbi:MAG: tetratricopeptide repeat protein [Saprospiraceae bacterium]
MKASIFTVFRLSIGLILILACVSQKKKGEYKGLKKFYHNTTAKYNAYFNANELLEQSIDRINGRYKDDYSKLLSVFPYEAIEDVNSEKPNLDKAIEKVASDINLHRYSRWADDCYLIIAKAQYLKKDYETAEGSYEYLLNEYQPSKILERSKALKAKSEKAIKKEKETKKEDLKKEAQKRAKAKAKAKEKAKKEFQKNKSKNKTSTVPGKEIQEKEIPTKAKDSSPTTAKNDNKAVTNVGSKVFPHRPAYWEASIWSAKNLIRRGKYYEAEYKLQEIENDPATADKYKGELFATKSHLFLYNENYEKAIPQLKQAIQFADNKKLKARYAFILGQLYLQLNRPVSAEEYFNQVIKYHPSYEMAFHAKMNLLINKSLQGESEELLISSLERLLKDSKNAEYGAEINYSIGQIYYNNKKWNESIEYLNKAVWFQNANNNVKADAYNLLANIHFDQSKFQPAKYYFDSTLMFLGKSDKRRSQISKMVYNLKDIAEQIEIINLQDSLIRISSLSTKEKRALAIQIKNKKKIETLNPDQGMSNSPMDKAFRNPDMIQTNRNAVNFRNPKDDPKAVIGAKSTFFAYDIKATNRGRSAFENYWGDRVLEDNWRRSKKTAFGNNITEIQDSTKERQNEVLEEDLAELLAGIPSSPEEIKAAHKKIEEAMFQLGVAYRDKIESFERSKETLDKLLLSYPETSRYADALYYLYLNCLDLKDQACADQNNNLLKTRFADSYYNKLINDPEYAKSLMNKKDELEMAYERAFKLFESQNYEESQKILQALNTKVNSNSPLKAKIAIMSAFCIGKTSGKDSYMAALKDVVANYPGTAQESKAKEMLRFLRGDNDAFEVVSIKEMESVDFKIEDEKIHYMMIVFFTPPAKQVDKAKIAISDYHQKYHKLDNLKMTSVEINTEQNITAILIRKFDDKPQAMKYFNTVQKNLNEYIPGFQSYEIYPISQNNYREVLRLRTVKEYQAFFKKNYEGS